MAESRKEIFSEDGEEEYSLEEFLEGVKNEHTKETE